MPEDKKHFDVAQPGQLPVSHTSRPVIVGQQNAPVGDPMMRGGESEGSRTVSDHKVSLKPIHPDTKSEPTSDPSSASGNEETQSPQSDQVKTETLDPSQNPEVQKLVNDKTYKLPIKTPARKFLNVFVVITVVTVLIVLIATYLMMNQ